MYSGLTKCSWNIYFVAMWQHCLIWVIFQRQFVNYDFWMKHAFYVLSLHFRCKHRVLLLLPILSSFCCHLQTKPVMGISFVALFSSTRHMYFYVVILHFESKTVCYLQQMESVVAARVPQCFLLVSAKNIFYLELWWRGWMGW